MRMLLRELALIALFVILAILVGRIVEGLSATSRMTPSTPTATVSAKPTPIGGGTGRIAFVTFGKNQIYTVNADGTGLIHLTDVITEPQSLQWSSDGTHLAFSTFDVESEIYVMNADGSGLIHLANTIGVGNFSWSPDGKRIAYDSRNGFLGEAQIYTIKTDRTELTQLTSEPGSRESPAWSPDGKRIAFQYMKDRLSGPSEIHVMSGDGSGEIKLADGWSLQALLWSPDNTRILSASNGSVQIFVMNADGSQRLQLTNSLNNNLLGSWSPDSRRIVFTTNRDGNSELYVMNSDGSEQKNLTNSPSVDEGYPEWSPDGHWIAFVSVQRGSEPNCCLAVAIHVMKADGSEQRRLTNEVDSSWRPAWQP